MKVSRILIIFLALSSFSLPACDSMHAEEPPHQEQQKIVVTSPLAKDVTMTQQYVCQIHSQRHIEVCALQDGYLQEILIKEGQMVKQNEVMFRILPILYKARLAAEQAEANLMQIKYDNTRKLYESTPPIVSIQEVLLAQAELDKAKAKLSLSQAELDFATVKAPFDGIADRLNKQLGSLIEKKDVLTTLSDNSVMWVYFNVPEARYLEYKSIQGKSDSPQHLKLADARIELILAGGRKFNHTANDIVTIEGKFNNETGNIPFRADFQNPDGLLRHGQTGNVLIHRTLKKALVIPQRATFEILDKRFVYVIGDDHIVHQREIEIEHEMDDVFVISKGLDVKDKIVFEGIRHVRDGDKVEFEFRKPEEALANQKKHAE